MGYAEGKQSLGASGESGFFATAPYSKEFVGTPRMGLSSDRQPGLSCLLC